MLIVDTVIVWYSPVIEALTRFSKLLYMSFLQCEMEFFGNVF